MTEFITKLKRKHNMVIACLILVVIIAFVGLALIAHFGSDDSSSSADGEGAGSDTTGGVVSTAGDHDNSSTVFSSEEVNAAFEAAQTYFEDSYTGCTMTDMYYNETDYILEQEESWSETFDGVTCIIIQCDFTTGPDEAPLNLDPDNTYEAYNFILSQNEDGTWQVRGGGYV